jgi:hypothetical protein
MAIVINSRIATSSAKRTITSNRDIVEDIAIHIDAELGNVIVTTADKIAEFQAAVGQDSISSCEGYRFTNLAGIETHTLLLVRTHFEIATYRDIKK